MNDFRDSLVWIIGSAIAGGVAVVSWVFESGLLATLLGIMIGAGLTFLVQTRTQKRTWKREYAVRIAVEVYGELFGGVKSISLSLKDSWYKSTGFIEWREMQDDHRYYMVDEKFRNRLDKFQDRLEKKSATSWEIRQDILPKIVLENVEEILGIRTNKVPHTIVNYIRGQQSIQSSPDLIECLISETHPSDKAIQHQKGVSVASYSLEITPIGEPTIKYDDSAKLNQFWESTLRKLQQNSSHDFIKTENDNLIKEAENLKQEIANRIEKPWKI